MRFSLLLPIVALGACATVPVAPIAPVVADTGGVCRNAGLGSFVGRPSSAALGAEMRAASGARVLRWVAKGMMVTMDYREDRLTVRLDATNRVESLACG